MDEKNSRGAFKVEFYSHLEEIKNLYFDKGMRVFKILYDELKQRHSLTISYKMFCYYARQELKLDSTKSFNNESVATPIIEQVETPKKEEHEPIIARPNFSKVRKFNPHTTDLRDDQIIGKNK